MRDYYRLDGCVVVVDAEYGEENLDEYPVAAEQVALADLILLNKMDLVDPSRVDRLQRRLQRMNPVAQIIRTEYCATDLHGLLNVRLFESVPAAAKMRETDPDQDGRETVDRIRSVVLTERRPLDKDRVNLWIKDLFMTRGYKILRGKGFLNFSGSEYRYVFQSVRRTFHSQADRLWQPDEPRESVIVLIGEGLEDQTVLQQSFSACVA